MTSTQLYMTDSVGTAGPAQLVLALYDGALGAVQRAETLMKAVGPEGFTGRAAATNIQAVSTQLLKAQRIVSGLRQTLDFTRGGAIAANLDALYCYCQRLLVEANMSKSPENLAPVMEVVRDLRSAWAAACCH
jgi:flagellar protein FliS